MPVGPLVTLVALLVVVALARPRVVLVVPIGPVATVVTAS